MSTTTPLLESREQAKARGCKTYLGQPCRKSGHRERYVNSNACVPCSRSAATRSRRKGQQRAEEGTKKQREGDFRFPLTEWEDNLAWQALCYALRTRFWARLDMECSKPLGWPYRNLEADEVVYYNHRTIIQLASTAEAEEETDPADRSNQR